MDSPKKIFRLFSRLNVGGPSLHVVNLAHGLDSLGYRTKLIVGQPEASEGSMAYYALEKNVDVLSINSFQAAISARKDLQTLFELVWLFWTEKPDIVHTHTFKAGFLGRIAAFIARVPVVVHTYHGHLLAGYANRWKVRLLVFIEHALSLVTDRLITVSPKIATDLVNSGIGSREKFQVVELGFDVGRLISEIEQGPTLRHDLKISKDAEVVGIVGRLVPIKSVDLFIRSLAPLLTARPGLHLVIVGDGQESEALHAYAASFREVADRIHFTGWRRSVARDMRDLDVCVCSSKNEGTSVSIIEAVIAGVPVVSTHVGGMGDLLGGGRWGELVAYDEQALRAGVEKVCRQPQAIEKALQASTFFKDRFSERRLSCEIDQVYRQIQSEKSAIHHEPGRVR